MKIKIKNIMNNKNAFDKYKCKIFSQGGYDTLERYTNHLVKEYLIREEYPFKFGIVLGLPFFDWALIFNSKEELLYRIKGNAALLGIEEFNITLGVNKWQLKIVR